MSELEIRNLNKTFRVSKKSSVTALDNISLNVGSGEFAVLVGPSGCGKSTLLNIVAGLDTCDPGGEVLLDGKQIKGPGADRGMVFQSYTLFPWLSVRKNIEFGPSLRNVSEPERRTVAEKFIKETGLTGFEDMLPGGLSGGMKQRVAIARTLANSPKMLLMDEPFGALDAQTRAVMQEMLSRVWQKERTTVLFVTHDIDEAILMGTKIYVMSRRPGRIKQMIPVNISGERGHKVTLSPEFLAIKQQIMDLIWEESEQASMEVNGDGI